MCLKLEDMALFSTGKEYPHEDSIEELYDRAVWKNPKSGIMDGFNRELICTILCNQRRIQPR